MCEFAWQAHNLISPKASRWHALSLFVASFRIIRSRYYIYTVGTITKLDFNIVPHTTEIKSPFHDNMDLMSTRRNDQCPSNKPGQDQESNADLCVEELGQESARDLASKAGYISLRERLSNLTEATNTLSYADHDNPNSRPLTRLPPGNRQAAQFATLQEFFQSKSAFMRKKSEEGEDQDDDWKRRRTRVPIMKLTKDDWNVKCWEERLSGSNSRKRNEQVAMKRLDGRQWAVFHGRIEEVASKLDKMREGAPIDEELARLLRTRQRPAMASSDASHKQEWIGMLKEELKSGTHNSRVLREQVAKQVVPVREASGLCGGGNRELQAEPEEKSEKQQQRVEDRVYSVRLPHLGRPIRRLSQDDED